MKKDKIKALLSLKGLNMTSYANCLGKSKQQISNKNKTDVWSLDEIIKLADLTNTTLAFNDKETGKSLIEFDNEDIKENE
jgi:hypothetical protein